MESNKLELIISTEIAPGVGLPKEIMFNYDALKTQLTQYVSKYDGLVVGDGEVAEARHIRAEINKVIGQLSKAGTDTKAKWNAPLNDFLARVKELVGIAKPIEAKIGEQIKAHDAAERDKKRKQLMDFLASEVLKFTREVSLAGNVEFHALDADTAEAFVASKHWAGCVKEEMLNASASDNRSRTQLTAEVRRCRASMEQVRRVYAARGAEWVAKAYYALMRWDFDGTTACRDVDRQIAEAERIASRPKQEPSAEEVAKQKLAEARAAAVHGGQGAPVPAVRPSVEAQKPAPEPAPAPAPSEDDPEMGYTLRITGPRSKLFALRDWLTANGLKFERA